MQATTTCDHDYIEHKTWGDFKHETHLCIKCGHISRVPVEVPAKPDKTMDETPAKPDDMPPPKPQGLGPRMFEF